MEINAVLKQRLCMPIDISGTAEYVLSVVLSENLVFPRNELRKFTEYNGLRIDAKTNENAQLSLKAPRALAEVVSELCERHSLRVTTDEGTLVIAARYVRKV